jgi:hypothetical protein
MLLQAGLPPILQHPKRSTADPFLQFIRGTLERAATLTRQPARAMVRERGCYEPRPVPTQAVHLLAARISSPGCTGEKNGDTDLAMVRC